MNYDGYAVSKRMGVAIEYRGPDSDGIWQDANFGINLIHRRLAILDLSPAGHQPMLSKSGRYVIVFNGEIYNYKHIIAQLESKLGDIVWQGHSDTEVILLAIETYGFQKALEMLEGMFAIALWDKQDEKLYLSRDRLGEKPLYYGYFNGVFGFTSELKAFKEHPKFNNEINRDAIQQLMMVNCIPAPLSIFENIHKLLPGHYLEITYKQFLDKVTPSSTPYWKLEDCRFNSYAGSVTDATNHLDKLIRDVIQAQMVADVPVGCFLSGGVDSSLVAGIMQDLSPQKIETFSIGFDQKEYNEAIYAKEVAKHLGTNHNELYVTAKDTLNVVDRLPQIYNEPFSDSSQIPTFLVSEFAKQKVTVSLSGDGGDELFAGYTRYLQAESLYNKMNSFFGISKLLAKGLTPLLNDKLCVFMNKVLGLNVQNIESKRYKIEHLLNSRAFIDFYLALTTHWYSDNLVLKSHSNHNLWNREIEKFSFNENKVLGMQYLDTLGYLPDDILVKVDRAAMANSLETRTPLLNHKIVEFAFTLPAHYKIQHGSTKHVLRNVLYKYVPKHLIERPKQGFSIPIQNWLKEDLRDWACDILNPHKIKSQGYLNSEIIEKYFKLHLSGSGNFGYQLWDVLMFQQWLDNWKK
jgi:asparagine synthase (glutamine-hydrolysing)